MSGIQDEVLAAICDGCASASAVCDNTGLEPNQVHQAVFILKKAGKVIKGRGGYALADGAEVEPDDEVAAKTEPGKPRKARAGRSGRSKRAAPAESTRVAVANGHRRAGNGAVEFACFGDFVVLKRCDVVELLLVMERWRQMIEATAA